MGLFHLFITCAFVVVVAYVIYRLLSRLANLVSISRGRSRGSQFIVSHRGDDNDGGSGRGSSHSGHRSDYNNNIWSSGPRRRANNSQGSVGRNRRQLSRDRPQPPPDMPSAGGGYDEIRSSPNPEEEDQEQLPKSTFSTLEADLDETIVEQPQQPQPQPQPRDRPPSAPPLFAYPALSLSFPSPRSSPPSSDHYPSRLATSSARYPPLFSPGTGLREEPNPNPNPNPNPARNHHVALSPETSLDGDDATSMDLPSIWSRIAPSQPQPRPHGESKSELESESHTGDSDSATTFEEASTTRLPPSWSDLERIMSKSKKHHE